MSFAVAQYQQARVNTVSPVQVLVSLYQGAVRFLREAIARHEARDLAGRARSLAKAHAILCELRATLDHDRAPELCAQLDGLYDFCLHRIQAATIENDGQAVEPAITVLENLLAAWSEIARRTP